MPLCLVSQKLALIPGIRSLPSKAIKLIHVQTIFLLINYNLQCTQVTFFLSPSQSSMPLLKYTFSHFSKQLRIRVITIKPMKNWSITCAHTGRWTEKIYIMIISFSRFFSVTNPSITSKKREYKTLFLHRYKDFIAVKKIHPRTPCALYN